MAALTWLLQSQFEVTLSFCSSYKSSVSKVSLPPPPPPALQGPGGAMPLCSSPVPWGQGDNSSALSLGAAFPWLPGAGPAIPEGP